MSSPLRDANDIMSLLGIPNDHEEHATNLQKVEDINYMTAQWYQFFSSPFHGAEYIDSSSLFGITVSMYQSTSPQLKGQLPLTVYNFLQQQLLLCNLMNTCLGKQSFVAPTHVFSSLFEAATSVSTGVVDVFIFIATCGSDATRDLEELSVTGGKKLMGLCIGKVMATPTAPPYLQIDLICGAPSSYTNDLWIPWRIAYAMALKLIYTVILRYPMITTAKLEAAGKSLFTYYFENGWRCDVDPLVNPTHDAVALECPTCLALYTQAKQNRSAVFNTLFLDHTGKTSAQTPAMSMTNLPTTLASNIGAFIMTVTDKMYDYFTSIIRPIGMVDPEFKTCFVALNKSFLIQYASRRLQATETTISDIVDTLQTIQQLTDTHRTVRNDRISAVLSDVMSVNSADDLAVILVSIVLPALLTLLMAECRLLTPDGDCHTTYYYKQLKSIHSSYYKLYFNLAFHVYKISSVRELLVFNAKLRYTLLTLL